MSDPPQPTKAKRWFCRRLPGLCTAWSRLLNAEIPVSRGYPILGILAVLVCAVWLVGHYLDEQRLIEGVRQNPDSRAPYGELSAYLAPRPRRERKVFERLQADFPDSPYPPLMLANAHSCQARGKAVNRQLVLDYVDLAAQRAPARVDDLLELYHWYYHYGEFDRATELVLSASQVVTGADASPVHYWTGRVLHRTGRLQDAALAFQSCADSGAVDDLSRYRCPSELVAGTRELTITLQSDRLFVQTYADVDVASPQISSILQGGSLPSRARLVAWQSTEIGPYRLASLRAPTETWLQDNRLRVWDSGWEIKYAHLWHDAQFGQESGEITLDQLPVAAFTMPTTVTVRCEGSDLVSTTFPYQGVNGQTLVWRMDRLESPGRPLVLTVAPHSQNRLFVKLGTSVQLRNFNEILLYAAPTILGLLILVKIRHDSGKQDRASRDGRPSVQGWRLPTSALYWVNDLFLVAVCVVTVLYPLWWLVTGSPYLIYENQWDYVLYVAVLAWCLLQLALLSGSGSPRVFKNAYHLGAVIFTCYLVPLVETGTVFLVCLLLSGLAYYALLLRDHGWLSGFPWQRVKTVLAQGRASFVERIFALDRYAALAKAIGERDLLLAQGKIKLAEYNQTQETLDRFQEAGREKQTQLQGELDVPPRESLKRMLFALGPGPTPLADALVAWGFGMLPYLAFIVLAHLSGNLWQAYRGGLDLFSLSQLSYDVLAVPWGPLSLLLFGYFFHAIWGKHGVTKGLLFGLTLSGVSLLHKWIWSWNPADLVEYWGTAIRTLVTLVFTGTMMDWMAIKFSWRRMGRSYDSPALASLLATVGATVTTFITGLLTGTLSRLLAITAQGISAALNVPLPPMP